MIFNCASLANARQRMLFSAYPVPGDCKDLDREELAATQPEKDGVVGGGLPPPPGQETLSWTLSSCWKSKWQMWLRWGGALHKFILHQLCPYLGWSPCLQPLSHFPIRLCNMLYEEPPWKRQLVPNAAGRAVLGPLQFTCAILLLHELTSFQSSLKHCLAQGICGTSSEGICPTH